MVRWDTVGLLGSHDGSFLGLHSDARYSNFNSEVLKRSCFDQPCDNPGYSVVEAFRLVQLGLPGWGSVVDQA